RESPIYSLLLSTGLANMSALARAVKPLVDAMVGRDVKIPTIVKALERLRDRAEARLLEGMEGFGKVEVSTYSGMAVVEDASVDLNALKASKEPFIAVSDGSKIEVLAPSRLLGRGEADMGLVKVVFPKRAPVGAVTALVMLMRAAGIFPEHVLRRDNEIYIVAKREDVPAVLSLVERIKQIERSIRD
ncbi:MAG: hypothetical protein QXK62_10640, partial [Thermoproteus sp.]